MKRIYSVLCILLVLFGTIETTVATRLVDVKILDKNFIVVYFKDGDVEFKDNGVGKNAYGSHHHNSEDNWVRTYGTALNTNMAMDINNWLIKSSDDSNFGSDGVKPTAVYRKTKVNGHAEFGWLNDDYQYQYTYKHFVYLELPNAMEQGKNYSLKVNINTNTDKTSVSFTFDIFRCKSEAIHVNIVGYSEKDNIKAADLYHWMGDGYARDYSEFEGNTVYLYDVDRGTTQDVGTVEYWKPNSKDVGGYNMMRSDVWKADFTGYTTPGKYKLVVEGIGCSDVFEIKNDIYFNPFKVSTKGFFYMRIGQDNMDMMPVPRRPLYIPGTSPENCKVYLTTMHPYHSDWSGNGDRWDQPDFFAKYKKSGNPTNPNVFGGHSDALDWDRHLGHVSIIYDMLLPYFITNGTLSEDNLGIAESGNGIPDILDEARNEVDFWLRLRDGMSYGHGLTNPNSRNELFQAESTAIAAWANAANCAMLANCFKIANIDDLSKEYTDSAEVAFHYALGLNTQMLDYVQSLGEAMLRGRDFKMMAAAYLYNVTGNTDYEDIMKAESVVTSPTSEMKKHKFFDQIWATAAYLFTDQTVNYPTLHQNMKASVIHQAKQKEVANIQSRPSRRATDEASGYFHVIQNVHRTIIAHAISDNTDDKQLFENALTLEADWSLGRNPLNMLQMTTATSCLEKERSVINAYTSGRNDGFAGMHPGHTPYMNTDNWYCGMTMGCPKKLYEKSYPSFSLWPQGEALYNTRYVWAHVEFTPQQTMRGKMALYGYLYGISKPTIKPHDASDPFDNYYKFSGRTALNIDGGPVMYYAGSFINVKFEGTSVKAVFTDIKSKKSSKIGFIVDDGTPVFSTISPNTTDTFTIATGLADTVHTLVMYKREDNGAGIFGLQFNGLILDDKKGILPGEKPDRLRFEFYGDSFTAGVCEKEDNDGYYSYPNICSRILDADVYNNGIGGLAVKDNTGWYQSSTTGLETTYNKLNASNENGNSYTTWNFERYIPNVVVFGLGINDAFGKNAPFDNPEDWKENYKNIIRTIIDKYGKQNTKIVLAPGNIPNDGYTYSQQVIDELKKEGYAAYYFQFTKELDEHPNPEEHKAMGEELAAFIKTILFKSYTTKPNTYSVTIQNGSGSGLYEAGEIITIKADENNANSFIEWTGDIKLIDNTQQPLIQFTMPAETVKLTATFETSSLDKYNIDKYIKVYPNPTNGDSIYIEILSSQTKTNRIKIFNEAGKILFNKEYHEKQKLSIPVNNWPTGVYFIQINKVTKELILE